MAYEFKKLSDVEVVAEPIEAANVLIEENGVIKKAPKTAVGGAGGGEADMIITINLSYFENTCNLTYNNIAITSGGYEKVLEAIRAKRKPVVKIIYDGSDEYCTIYEEIDGYTELYGENLIVYYTVPKYTVQIAINSDGSLGYGNIYSYNVSGANIQNG